MLAYVYLWLKSTNEIQHFYDFICLLFVDVVFSFFLIVVSQIEMGFVLPLLAWTEKFPRDWVDIVTMPQEMDFE